MMVPMPAAIVLIVCKTTLAAPPDSNAAYTRWEDRNWATEHSMMICRRHEVQVHDIAVDQGASPQSFNLETCQRSAIMLGSRFDAEHKNTNWRFWRVACPVPIVRQNPDGSEDIIAWKLPECGHRDTVRCEVDSEI